MLQILSVLGIVSCSGAYTQENEAQLPQCSVSWCAASNNAASVLTQCQRAAPESSDHKLNRCPLATQQRSLPALKKNQAASHHR